ncbi:MAG: hypothetical protein H8D23_12730 [Candidatus Brocadiales bacterium]|nr:hypothetical protein [Candidatus Brocadiales bacterium]
MKELKKTNFESVVNSLSDERYNVGVWIEDCLGDFEKFVRSLPPQSVEKISTYNIVTILLSEISNNSKMSLGVFGLKDFNKWAGKQIAEKNNKKIVIYTEFDALLATWSKIDAINFFSTSRTYYYNRPLVLISKVKNIILSSDFPESRIWSIQSRES